MPIRRYKNLTYRDNMTVGELAAWHREHASTACAAFPARAMLAKVRVVTMREVTYHAPLPAATPDPTSLPTTPPSMEDVS